MTFIYYFYDKEEISTEFAFTVSDEQIQKAIICLGLEKEELKDCIDDLKDYFRDTAEEEFREKEKNTNDYYEPNIKYGIRR